MNFFKQVGNYLTLFKKGRIGNVEFGTQPDDVVTLSQLESYGSTATYKKYVALLTQSGLNVPTAVILENTLGGTPTMGRPNVGEYTVTLTGVFTANKTTLIITPRDGEIIGTRWTDANTITITTYLGLASDNVLNNTTFEIRVYS